MNKLIDSKPGEIDFEHIFNITPDLIFILDNEHNILRANDAFVKRIGMSSHELIGSKCYRCIHQAEEPPVDCPHSQMIKNGQEHTEKMFSEFLKGWFSVAVKPLKDEQGKVCGSLHIARDITESNKKEAELVVAQQLYRELFENVNIGILRSTPGPEGFFIDVNPAMVKMLEADTREQLMSLHPSEIYWDASQRKIVSDAILAKGFVKEVVRFKTIKGRPIWCYITGIKKIGADGQVYFDNTIEDISERKNAEDVLLERDVRLKKLSVHVPGMIYQFGKKPDGTYFVPFSSEAIRDIFGCSPQDVLNDFSPIARVILPEDLQKVVDSIDYSAKTLTVWKCEYRVQIPGQAIRWMFGQSTPEKMADGSIIWHGFNTDITERKQTELQLKKLNRTYALLSEINQMIVRVHQQQVLFDEACKIAVSQGGFRMAWIGLLDPLTKQVNPVAYAGETGKYLERINVILDESDRGRGPTATALLTGSHIVANDIVSDPRMTPWREDALKLGYCASAVFPFNISGGLRGTLTLYSPEANFFDDEELKLLDEMTADIAFAMEFIEEEQQHKQAEETLRERESRYRTLIENIPQKIFLKDLDYSYLSVNKHFARDFGVQPADMVGKTDYSYFPKEFADKYRSDDQKIMDSGQIEEFEEKYILEGKETWVQTIKSPVKDENGKILALLGIFHDISERKQAEELLRNSEIKLRSILDATPFPIALVDLQDDKIKFWSKSAMTLFGHTAPTTFEWYLLAYPDPRYRLEVIERWKPALEKAKQSASTFNTGEYQITCKDGSVRICELYATFLSENLAVTFNDITHRKLAQNELSRSEAEFRMLAEAMPQIVWMTRADGWNIYFNQQWVDYTGQSLEESYGHGWNKPFHPDDQKRAWDAWQNAVNNRATYSLECRLRRADGVYKWWLIRGVPQLDEHGAVIKWFGTCTDIEELKRSEKELRYTQSVLQAALDQSQAGIAIADAPDGILRYVNDAALLIRGGDRKDLVDRIGIEGYLSIWQILDIDGLPLKPDEVPLARAIMFGEINSREFIVRRDTGDDRIVLGNAAPIKDESGKVIAGIVIFLDITEQKQIEKSLRRSEEELRKAQQITHVGNFYVDFVTN
ncbi:MAG: PAS domain S-box protein, partial [Bacteroidetes bacterium]|nr:PAS domain S-box protein [Bacteroidota bacterium]